MVTRQVVTHIDPDYAVNQWFGQITAEQEECMSQGHSWPRIKPGRALPKGISADAGKLGVFQITETCPVCKTRRQWTTLPGGAFDMDIEYRYSYPDNWVRRQGIDVTRRDIRAHVWDEFGRLIAASAPAGEEKDEKVS